MARVSRVKSDGEWRARPRSSFEHTAARARRESRYGLPGERRVIDSTCRLARPEPRREPARSPARRSPMVRRIPHPLRVAFLGVALAAPAALAGRRALFDNFHAEQAG